MKIIPRTFTAGQRPAETPFDVREGRVMLSLGPLSKKKYCTYSCPFCYVGGDFLSYASMTPGDIVAWVEALRQPYDIIYVSCDTDSFAPPREQAALELIERLSLLGVDLLFTTRAVLSDATVRDLGRIATRLAADSRMLIGCVSLVQLTVPHLEPKPIPSPEARIAQLGRLRAAGLRTVLALRPFLPNVPLADLSALVELAAPSVDLVLGGVWYYDRGGVLQGAVLGPDGADLAPDKTREMPFDNNGAEWNVFEGHDAEATVREACRACSVPMFMRSGPAVDWLRSASLLVRA